MSALNHLFNLPEQLCYVQCGFCTTILLVSVPCSSMSMAATVRCGHCAKLLSVNMMRAPFVPLHFLASLSHDHEPKEEVKADKKEFNRFSPSILTSSDNEEEDALSVINHVVNKPPEKRQRAPSAYNRFIKEEIRRLKTRNPKMAHKEAFSTAAKNWAQFPPIQHKGDGESCGQDDEKGTWNFEATDKVRVEGNGFHERKAPRHS